MSKTSPADIAKANDTHGNLRQHTFNLIKTEHPDSAACHQQTLNELFVEEFNNTAHSHFERRKRDEFPNKAKATADINIIRHLIRYLYSPTQTSNTIMTQLEG